MHVVQAVLSSHTLDIATIDGAMVTMVMSTAVSTASRCHTRVIELLSCSAHVQVPWSMQLRARASRCLDKLRHKLDACEGSPLSSVSSPLLSTRLDSTRLDLARLGSAPAEVL